jgi:hypothetical protein
MADILAGATFEVRYPFLRELVSLPPDDPEGGCYETMSWRPGAKLGEDLFSSRVHGSADGEGAMLLSVVAVCPLGGRYQARVFYTRRWRDPDGKVFGKSTALRVCTLEKFRRISRGFRFEYEVVNG